MAPWRQMGTALLACGCAGSVVEAQSNPHAALSATHHIAEGDTGKPPAGAKANKPAPAGSQRGKPVPANANEPAPADGPGGKPVQPGASPEPSAKRHDLPDPQPLVEVQHFEYVVRYRRGTLSVVSVRPVRTERPVATARRMGRFAFELWIGRELIDRVRFDFPLLAAAPAPDDPDAQKPNLAAGADVEQTIVVPASDRATYARILDRASGKEVVVPWPPVESSVSLGGPGD